MHSSYKIQQEELTKTKISFYCNLSLLFSDQNFVSGADGSRMLQTLNILSKDIKNVKIRKHLSFCFSSQNRTILPIDNPIPKFSCLHDIQLLHF